MHKVVSHQAQTAEVGVPERWVVAGNQAADKQAEIALQEHPCSTEHQRLQAALAKELELVGHVQALILRIGKKTVQSKPTKVEPSAGAQ